MDKTYVPKGQIAGKWHLVDAEGQTLGRLATRIASLLIGKHNPEYTPGVVMEDHVVVINASKIQANATTAATKKYYRHSGYPGGLKQVEYATQLERHPDRIVRFAVKGMLPKNPLGRAMFKKLKVYAGTEHQHTAQQPTALEI